MIQTCIHTENIKQFYNCHADRQGIAVLAFSVSSGTIETLHQRYLDLHPNLLVEEYSNDVKTYSSCKVLEVYSYYKGDKGGEVDKGTRLRFVQQLNDGDDHDDDNDENYHCLPGIVPIDATFDETCMSAYCDHWVSNGTFLFCAFCIYATQSLQAHNLYLCECTYSENEKIFSKCFSI